MILLEEENAFNSKCILIEPKFQDSDSFSVNSGLSELKSLTKTLGLDATKNLIVNIRRINPALLIGTGKALEIKELALELEANILVFDYSLSPTMQRNLEQITGLCVIDREEVIIQIFADRAQTKEAKIQVQLARLKYSLPRLTRKWTNLSQTRGGVRGGKGSGEKQLELDRRYVENQINVLNAELIKVQKQRSIQRNSRQNNNIKQISIVGYTNSGKSSLLNKLTQSSVLEEDKLFATLDTITRKLELPNSNTCLLTDTVGFVSNLPHHLIDSFKSTLEETKYADILLIVCDATHPSLLKCFNTTIEVLESLQCLDKKIIVALNKIDAVTQDNALLISRLKMEAQKLTGTYPIEISVKTGENLDKLIHEISKTIEEDLVPQTITLPLSEAYKLHQIKKDVQVKNIQYGDQEIIIDCLIPKENKINQQKN